MTHPSSSRQESLDLFPRLLKRFMKPDKPVEEVVIGRSVPRLQLSLLPCLRNPKMTAGLNIA